MKKNNFLLATIASGLGIHLLNSKVFTISKDRLSKRKLKQRVFNWKFGTISYKKIGSGEPLLLIHDTFSGSSSIEYDRIITQLAKHHTVYSFDLLGYGYSERSTITYTAFLYVQLINDFIHEVIERTQVDIVTTGNSNVFALFAAHQEQETIRKIIMINPGDLRLTSMNPSKRDHTIKYILELPFIGTSVYNILHSKKNYKNQFNITANSGPINHYIDQFYHNAHFDTSNARFSFASYIGNYLNISVKNTLKEINNSIYIINGFNREVGAEFIEKQYLDLNPAIECAKVKKSSDFPHLENPYATIDLLQLFLQD